MARARRTWGVLSDIIDRQLKEKVDANEFWSPALILDVWNEGIDLRTMDLQDAHEGFSVQLLKATTVEGDRAMTVPDGAEGFRRILYYDADGEQEWPLIRAEQFSEPTSLRDRAGVRTLPSYSLKDNHVFFDPPFANSTDEIRFEIENATTLFVDDNSAIPASWPLTTESMLILDCLTALFDTEAAQSDGVQMPRAFRDRHRRYEKRWMQRIETRSRGRVFGTPNRMGG